MRTILGPWAHILVWADEKNGRRCVYISSGKRAAAKTLHGVCCQDAPGIRTTWAFRACSRGLVASGRRLAVTSVAGVQRIAVTNGLANLFVTFPATAANGRLARWAVVTGLRFGACLSEATGVQRVAVTSRRANLFVTFPATAASGRIARWAVTGLRFRFSNSDATM